MPQEEAADVHQDKQQEKCSEAKAHHSPEAQTVEEGFCSHTDKAMSDGARGQQLTLSILTRSVFEIVVQ